MFASAEALAKAHRMKRAGSGYIGSCPACTYDNALSAKNGDEGKLLLHCHVGCAFDDVARALGMPMAFHCSATRRRPVGKIGSSIDDRNDVVRRLVARSVPAGSTAASRYLAARGITKATPPDIRFLPQHRHIPSRQCFPVMLGLVRDVAGHIVAIHRTYLAPSGRAKADVVPAKMTLGQVGGGAVRLHQSDVDLAELAVSEGIETGLSVAMATDFPVWAALSAGGIERLVAPPLPKANQIMIFADRDHHSRGQRAAECAAERFLAEGRRVRIVLPPKIDTDFNDLMREAG